MHVYDIVCLRLWKICRIDSESEKFMSLNNYVIYIYIYFPNTNTWALYFSCGITNTRLNDMLYSPLQLTVLQWYVAICGHEYYVNTLMAINEMSLKN